MRPTIDSGSLFAFLSSLAPLVSVTVGDPDDKQTWTIVFDQSATNPQKAAVNAAVAAFDPAKAAVRQERNARLSVSDSRSFILAAKAAAAIANGRQPSAALKSAMDAWEDYRQALRDMTISATPTWPVKPSDGPIP